MPASPAGGSVDALAPEEPTSWSGAASAARANLVLVPLASATGLAATVVVSHLLAIAEVGLYAIAIGVRTAVQYFADLGTGSASVRLFAEMHEYGAREQALALYRRLLLARVSVVAVIGITILVIPHTVSHALGLRGDEHYFLVFTGAIAAAEMTATLGYYALTALYAQKAANVVTLVAGVAQPTLVIAAAVLDLGLPGILTAVFLTSALRAISWNTLAVRRLRRMPAGDGRLPHVRRTLTTVSAASVTWKAGVWLNSRSFLSLLAAGTRGRAEIASFGLANDLVQQGLSVLVAPVSGVLLPLLARSKADAARTRRIFEAVGRLVALVFLPWTALLLILAPVLVPLVLGSRYPDALTYTYLLAPAFALEFMLTVPAQPLVLADDRLVRPFLVLRVATVLAAAAYLLQAHVALVVVVAYMVAVRIIATVALHVIIHRRVGLSLDWAWTGRFALVVATAAGIGLLLRAAVTGTIAQVVLCTLEIVVVCALGLRAFRLLRADDRAIVTRVVPPAARVLALLVRAP
jgi:O-antigen/teichoic acid export membrane protein